MRRYDRAVFVGSSLLVLGVIALLLWRVGLHHHDIQLFSLTDLAIHETSHSAMMWSPRIWYFAAGSVGQVLVPLLIAALFAYKRHWRGVAFCFAWAGVSAHEVAIYIADAPTQDLPLFGGDTHDWAWLLAPTRWNALGQAQHIADQVNAGGTILIGAGFVIALTALLYSWYTPARQQLP